MNLRTLLMVSSTLGVAGGILVSLLMLWVVQEPDPSELPRGPLKVDDRPLPLPRTLGEALLRLDKVLSDDNRRRILSLPDARTAAEVLDRPLGLWIRDEWELWRSDELGRHLEQMGLNRVRAMTSFIIATYYRWKRGQPLELAEQVAFFNKLSGVPTGDGLGCYGRPGRRGRVERRARVSIGEATVTFVPTGERARD